ncbi:hypothetical protein [Rhodoferax ferrireducens]|uniref:hypothetical protein n=1 Tax=Rhodoferax ferrireducens TaxID=192843 RepID=UPI000E0D3FFA|nr:hypothetical protein [Rhodoferax ferrireducens]
MSIPVTNLSIIVKAVESRPAEAALPSSLDDAILHQIARDLRLIELSCTVDDSIEPPLAGPMYLILHMMQSQSEKLKGKAKFQLAEDSLQHWLQRYMFYIEREIVSRAIKMPCQFDSDDLMNEIEQGILTTM